VKPTLISAETKEMIFINRHHNASSTCDCKCEKGQYPKSTKTYNSIFLKQKKNKSTPGSRENFAKSEKINEMFDYIIYRNSEVEGK